MNESHITVHGYVVAPPVVRKVGEHAVANFRIGVTPRRLEKTTGAWHDAETQWYAVSAWRALGENVAASLRKGDPVIVQGRLTARTWVNSQHTEVVAHDIEASFVGHDLRRGVTTFYKTAAPVAAQTAPDGASVDGYDLPEGQTMPSDLQDLIDGTGAQAAEPAAEAAGPADWNAPLADAPSFAGAA